MNEAFDEGPHESESFFSRPEGVFTVSFSTIMVIAVSLAIYIWYLKKRQIVNVRPPAESIEMRNIG